VNSHLPKSPSRRSNAWRCDDVLARQARDVRGRTADIFALDCNDALSLLRRIPADQFSASTAAKDDQIIFFRIGDGCFHTLGNKGSFSEYKPGLLCLDHFA